MQRRWKVWLGRTVDALAWLVLGVAVHVWVLRYLDWSWQPAIVLAAFAPYFGFSPVVALVLFAVRRRWLGTGLSALLTIAVIVTVVPLYLPSGAGEGQPITLLQANLRLGSANAPDLVDQIVSQHVDLLTVEELSPAEVTRLDAAGIASTLPYRFVDARSGGSGIGLFSRYPLLNEIEYPHYRLGVLSAQVQVYGVSVRVFAVHLLPPWPYPSGTWVRELAALRTVLTGLNPAQRTVIGGDFNSTLDNRQFRALLQHGFSDAASDTGAGVIRTFPADRFYPPLIGIDHVLTRGVTAASVDARTLTGSDHRALLAKLLV